AIVAHEALTTNDELGGADGAVLAERRQPDDHLGRLLDRPVPAVPVKVGRGKPRVRRIHLEPRSRQLLRQLDHDHIEGCFRGRKASGSYKTTSSAKARSDRPPRHSMFFLSTVQWGEADRPL